MSEQDLFNVGVGLISCFGGWLLRIIWQAIKDLQKRDAELAQKLSSVEVLVAGEYVKKRDVDKLADALFNKLDRIEDKLDKKADKQ